MNRRFAPLLVSLAGLVLVIAACSSGGTSNEVTVTVQVISEAGNPVIGAAFAFVDTSVRQSSVIDLEDGSYLSGLVQVDAEGRARITLPSAASLPAGALALASEAVPPSVQGSPCSAQAVPADARISVMEFEGVIVPSIVGVTDAGLSAESIVVQNQAARDPLHGWVYADRAVTLTLEGDGCGAGEPVAFEAGWNQIAVDYDAVADTATLRRSTASNLVVVVLDDR